jgi:hypothetical protein
MFRVIQVFVTDFVVVNASNKDCSINPYKMETMLEEDE